jgi:SAM-dependent methyltransferase
VSGLALSRRDQPELLEAPGQDPALLAGSLDDLARINRWLGGTRLTVRALERLTAGLPAGAELSVLDVGGGGGDIGAAVVGWARRRRLQLRLVVSDLSPAMLDLASARAAREDGVSVALADARALPFADDSFDVAISSLLLHHLSPGDAVTALREMGRVARAGVVANDLVRGWLGYVGARLVTRLITRNPITRHDGPVSVRRAYTGPELAALARRAGLVPVHLDGFLGYRVAMTATSRR